MIGSPALMDCSNESSPSRVKGILKNEHQNGTPDHHHDKHLKWDEAKLAEAEAGKSATMKITEPKTPFEHSIQSFSEEEKFRLHSDSDASNGGSSSIFGTSPSDWESGDEFAGMSEEERQKHHEQFEKMRKEHYRMKEALKKGRELVRSESEDSTLTPADGRWD